MSPQQQPAFITLKGAGYAAGAGEIIHDISLEVRPGEIFGIIGPNGAGKSTLLKIMAGILPKSEGEIYWKGQPYGTLSGTAFARQVAYLEQRPAVHWPLPAGKVIELGRTPHRHGLAPLTGDDETAINDAIKLTGIGHLRDRAVDTLSLGEFMLVALSRVFAGRPEVVLADEPVAALDPRHQLLVMETLKNFSADSRHFAAVVVLHDLNLAMQFCDRIALMDQGRVAACGTSREVITHENMEACYRVKCKIDWEQRLIIPEARL